MTNEDSVSNEKDGKSNIQLGFSEPMPEDRNIVGHRSAMWWNDWDGGQIGGRPSWLQPRDLPQKALKCRSCSSPLYFICQLYAPLESVPEAFHRSLYVFGCPLCCSSSSSSNNSSNNNNANNSSSSEEQQSTLGGIQVYRVQLPEENPFYPDEEDKVGAESWKKHFPSYWNVHVCQVCGQRANGKCPIQKKWFCCREHQKEYKKTVFDEQRIQNLDDEEDEDDDDGGTLSLVLPSLYSESELVVEEEPESTESSSDKEELPDTMFPSKKIPQDVDDDDDEDDSDQDLEQEDLNKLTGASSSSSRLKTTSSLSKTSLQNKNDPTTLEFYARVQSRKVPEQCLRYNSNWSSGHAKEEENILDDDENQPLWIRSDYQPKQTNSIPACPHCGTARRFEFQIMPQMLHYLHQKKNIDDARPNLDSAKQALMVAQTIIDEQDPSNVPPDLPPARDKATLAIQQKLLQESKTKAGHLDFGVVAVYSCPNSCSDPTTMTPSSDEASSSSSSSSLLGAYSEEFAWVQPSI